MYHYFYKIINKYDSKFYYGVHSTEDLNDNYMGSGTRIKRLIKKFGKDSFEKIILKFFKNKEEMFEYEKNFITEEILNNPNCYNLVNGGNGYQKGHIVTNIVKEKISKNAIGRENKQKGYKYIHKEYTNKMVPKIEIENYLKDGWELGMYISEESRKKLATSPWKGKHLTEETKKKMSISKKGKPSILKGKHLSEETKKKISKTLKGYKHTDEAKKNMSLSRIGKSQSEETKRKRSLSLKGHIVSEETKRKISIANKGKKKIRKNENIK